MFASSDPPNICASYRGVTVLVLGATGFIGRWVSRALTECSAAPHLILRNRARAERLFDRYGIRGVIHTFDLTDEQRMVALVRSIQPSITFNLAGYGVDRSQRDRETAYRINDCLLGVIGEAISACTSPEWPGLDLVHVGSALEYGEAGGHLAETATPKPITLYGRTKLAGTQRLTRLCRAGGIKGLTARLFTVYGPGEPPGRLLPTLLAATRTREPVALTAGTQKRDFTYVEDVAEGLLRLGLVSGSSLLSPAPPRKADQPTGLGNAVARAGSVVNLATGRLTTVRRFTEIAVDILQIPKDRLQFGALPIRKEEMEHDPVCVKRLRELLHWVPQTDPEEGIRRTRDFEVGG